jgi:hypothetical protein
VYAPKTFQPTTTDFIAIVNVRTGQVEEWLIIPEVPAFPLGQVERVVASADGTRFVALVGRKPVLYVWDRPAAK